MDDARLEEVCKLTEIARDYSRRSLERGLEVVGQRVGGTGGFAELVAYVPTVRIGAGANRPYALRLGYLLAGDPQKILAEAEVDAVTLDLAAAVELANCTITHVYDKIIDDDCEVAGQPALHRRSGVGRALLAGDALLCIARGLVSHKARQLDRCWEVIDTFDGIVLDCDHGQYLDIVFGHEGGASVNACNRINDLRTGQFVRRCAEIGALAAGAGEADLGPLRRAFSFYGRAVQEANDYLDIRRAMSPGGDGGWQDVVLWKKTKPLIYAVEMASSGQRRELLAALGSGTADPERVSRALQIVRLSGAMERARADLTETIESGIDALALLPASPARQEAFLYFEFVRSLEAVAEKLSASS